LAHNESLHAIRLVPIPQVKAFFCLLAIVYVVGLLGMLAEATLEHNFIIWVYAPFIVGHLYLHRRWAAHQMSLHKTCQDFKLDKCECSEEKDRPLVNTNIFKLMRWKEQCDTISEGRCLELFEATVRTHLSTKLCAAMGSVLSYRQVLAACLVWHGASSVDHMSGQKGLRETAVDVAIELLWLFVLLPLLLSGSSALARCFPALHRGWEVAWICTASILGILGPAALAYELDRMWVKEALISDAAFAVLVLTDCLGVVFIASLFASQTWLRSKAGVLASTTLSR